ncbi:DNA cytosine methyltransferase [Nocardioides sp. NPDC127514]|uniref:DNA cytosine methyltransferase n=1 Tax=unclassified Nocardioides TaxID=2615069 RepID=UPI003330EADA
MTLTAVDYFCGMGGSSSGLVEAGFEVQVAANHWVRAIETHSANHPGTEHLCADIQQVDVRYLPKADLLWASPICTELSQAGGRRKPRDPGQPGLWEEHGHVPAEAFERTRVTFWEVLRYAEVHDPAVVLVENVVEAADWHLIGTWLHGWTSLGYDVQLVCVSAAHVGGVDNDPAAQWRDRIYFGITRKDVPLLDLEPRPAAWCEKCGHDVEARQWWKPRAKRINGMPVGKYGPQYIYVCPEGDHGQVEPYVAPAASVIDWTDLGVRIGDRAEHGLRDLGPKTMARIRLGLQTIADPVLIGAGGNTWDAASGAQNSYLRAWPLLESPTPAQVTAIQNGIAMSEEMRKFVFNLNHGGPVDGSGGRWFDPETRPMPTNTIKRGEGLVMTEPFVSMLRNHGRNHPVTSGPVPTFSAGGFHHGLTIPPGAFVSAHHGGYATADPSMNKSVTEPLRTQTAQLNKSLVIPYRKGAKPYPATANALSALATREQHALLQAAIEVEDCYFRMLKPREAANAQRFPRRYVITGNQGEQQMQAGNAVAVNVAAWLGRRAGDALGWGTTRRPGQIAA